MKCVSLHFNVGTNQLQDRKSENDASIKLRSFSFYHKGGKVDNEFRPLSLLATHSDKLQFNGILSDEGLQWYVEDVMVKELSIEGYGATDDPKVVVYVRSPLAAHHDIWYRLHDCATEYQYIHDQFLWQAMFSKNVLDYLASWPPMNVTLKLFQADFDTWTTKRFGQHAEFKRWRSQHPSRDFRQAVNANVEFLYHQAYNLDEEYLQQPVWHETLRADDAVENHEEVHKSTIATPLVYQCFEEMYFASHIREVVPSQDVQEAVELQKRSLGFKDSTPTNVTPFAQSSHDGKVAIGDVVSVKRDEETPWNTTDSEWLCYVQGISKNQRLHVIWLYRPTDTTMSTARYPFDGEVFFSDHCNCNPDVAPIYPKDILRKYSVSFSNRPTLDAEYFVRQTYLTREKGAQNSFVTFTRKHLVCRCRRQEQAHRAMFEEGQTVYITVKNILEPVVVARSTSGPYLSVRRLLRLGRDFAPHILPQRAIPPNELVWTDAIFTISTNRIQRECDIRFFSEDDVAYGHIPVPYNRHGSGDYWVVCTRLVDGRLESVTHSLHMIEGPDPLAKKSCLRGLSVFSGGGNLDRGLEEGGIVKFSTAIDIEGPAIHTQLANASHPDLNLFYGSVNDYLYRVIRLKPQSKFRYAHIGDVDFISAGSPCPPFSLLQRDWKSPGSCQKASLVSTFCTLVDLYRPRYAIMENVVNMGTTRTIDGGQCNVLSSVIACLVAMGYQTRQFTMDAWSYGSCQSRTRLFIAIAAPGLTPISKPPPTHSHPPNIGNACLGKLPNGIRFGERDLDVLTPFRYRTAQQATEGLPRSPANISQICTNFPDHRGPIVLSYWDRALIRHIPTVPYNQTYASALAQGRIPKSLLLDKKEIGSSFKRIAPNGLIPTITTHASPSDSRSGGVVHWREHRILTIQEARRAQGIPDHEVIIGRSRHQWRVIGNAVDRFVALVIGLEIKKAWESSKTSLDRVKRSTTTFSEKRTMETSHAVKKTSSARTTIDTMRVVQETMLETIHVSPNNARKRFYDSSTADGSSPAKRAREHAHEAPSTPAKFTAEEEDVIFVSQRRRVD
jgi:DNA (cytosine-5)-methyltransferase 1